DHLMGISHRRKTRPDVDELPDALLGDPLGGPLMKTPVRPGGVGQLRRPRLEHLPGRPVRLEVVLTTQEEVVDTRSAGPRRVHPRGGLLSVVHHASRQAIRTSLAWIRPTSTGTAPGRGPAGQARSARPYQSLPCRTPGRVKK